MNAGRALAGTTPMVVFAGLDRGCGAQEGRDAAECWTESLAESEPRQSGCRYLLKAVVEYDGTGFVGFQLQQEGRTVQGELERALATVTGQQVRVVGAGRTDAGVHAKGQVVHFTVRWAHRLRELHRALNAVLAEDVAVAQLEVAPPGFHARYSARSREYVYTVYTGAVRSPLLQRYAHHEPRDVSIDSMRHACDYLLGRHDFGAFGSAPSGHNTVRTVRRAECEGTDDLIRVLIEADAFLRRMVRRLMGSLLAVGAGELSVDGIAGLLQPGHQEAAAVAAPPQGLCLKRVNY